MAAQELKINFLNNPDSSQLENSIDSEKARADLINEVKRRGFLQLPEEEVAFLKAEQRIVGQNRRNAVSAVTSGFTGLFGGAVSGFLGTFKAQWDKYGNAAADAVLARDDAKDWTAFSQKRALKNLEENNGGIANVSRLSANAAFANNYFGVFFQRQIRKTAGLVGSLVGLASCVVVAPINFFVKGVEQSTKNYTQYRDKIVQFDDVTRKALNNVLSGKTGNNELAFVPINTGESVAQAIARRRREIEEEQRVQEVVNEEPILSVQQEVEGQVSINEKYAVQVKGGREVPDALKEIVSKVDGKDSVYNLLVTVDELEEIAKSKYPAIIKAFDAFVYPDLSTEQVNQKVADAVDAINDIEGIESLKGGSLVGESRFEALVALGEMAEGSLPATIVGTGNLKVSKPLLGGTMRDAILASLGDDAEQLLLEASAALTLQKQLDSGMQPLRVATMYYTNAQFNNKNNDFEGAFSEALLNVAELKNLDIREQVLTSYEGMLSAMVHGGHIKAVA